MGGGWMHGGWMDGWLTGCFALTVLFNDEHKKVMGHLLAQSTFTS